MKYKVMQKLTIMFTTQIEATSLAEAVGCADDSDVWGRFFSSVKSKGWEGVDDIMEERVVGIYEDA